MNIVVCDDIDGAFQRSGELARLDEGALRVYDTVAEKRATILERLRDTRVAIAIRDRTVFDRETLNALPELRLIAVTAGPHRIDIKAATELGIVVAMTPAVSFASIAEYVFGLVIALARGIVPVFPLDEYLFAFCRKWHFSLLPFRVVRKWCLQ